MEMDTKNKFRMSMFDETYDEYEYCQEPPKYYKVYTFTEPLDQSRVDKYTRWFGRNKGSR